MEGRRRSEQGPAAPSIKPVACRTSGAGCRLVSPDDSADILFLMFAVETTGIVKFNTLTSVLCSDIKNNYLDLTSIQSDQALVECHWLPCPLLVSVRVA